MRCLLVSLCAVSALLMESSSPLKKGSGVVSSAQTNRKYGGRNDSRPHFLAVGEPKVDIAQSGKAATVIVEVKGKNAYATAFCVHATGLFLTTEGIATALDQSGGGKLHLVLNPGLKSQQSVPATVIRRDKGLKVALLRAEGQKSMPALSLGTDDQLTELVEIYSFGYTFDTSPPMPERTGYPTINVNARTVTSLEHKDGSLYRVQLNAALPFSNYAGPLLDKSGKLVGMGLPYDPERFLPVSRLAKFVTRPELKVTMPDLTMGNLHEALLFQAQAESVIPSPKPVTVELLLGEAGKERAHPMELVKGVYQVKAVPVPAPKEAPRLRVTVGYADAVVNGTMADTKFKIGDKGLSLRAVRFLEVQAKPRSFLNFKLDPQPRAILHSGAIVTGKLTGLGAVPVRVGEQTVNLDFGKAVDVRLETALEIAAVPYTLVVRQDGKELHRISDKLAVRGGTFGAEPPRPKITPPPMEKDHVIVNLPSPLTDVAVGGGGRYLIMYLPKLRKLAVFDASQARIVHYLPVAEDQVKFSAGLEKLVVAYPVSKMVQRFDLATFERELSEPFELKFPLSSITLGSSSKGPVLVAGGTGGSSNWDMEFLDLQTLKPLGLKKLGPGYKQMAIQPQTQVRASADGAVFSLWRGSGFHTFLVSDQDVYNYFDYASIAPIRPGPDGSVLFTGKGLITNQGKPVGAGRNEGYYTFPAHHGSFYLAFKRGTKNTLAVHLVGETEPILRLPAVDFGLAFDTKRPGDLLADKRLHLIPDARLLVMIPLNEDRLLLYRVDADMALERTGVNYLMVTAPPPLLAKKGHVYKHQLMARSNKSGLRYRLENGPTGMDVSPSGFIRWPVPPELGTADHPVVVSIRNDAGHERFYSFVVTLRD
jgi:hypothetical protein